MQVNFAPKMDTVIRKTVESIWKAYSLDELLEDFLSHLLHVDHVRKAEILLFNKRQDLIPVASAVKVGTKGKRQLEVRVQSWVMDSPVTYSTRKVNLPNMHFALSVPLLQGTETLGFLHMEFDRILTSASNKLPVFYLLGQQLSVKINEIMLGEEIKEARNELQNMTANNREMLQQVTSLSKELYAITAISTKINQSMDFDKSLRKSMTKVSEVFKASSVVFYMKEAGSSKLKLSAMDVSGDAFLGPRVLRRFLKKLEKNFVHDIFTLGRPLVKDLRPISKETDFEKMAEGGIRTLIGVPVNSKETNIGALLLLHNSAEKFNQSNLRLLSGMANIMGMAVENINLYCQTEQKKKEAAFLVDSIEKFHKTLDLKKTLRSVAEEGAKVTGENSKVYLFSRTSTPMIQVTYRTSDDKTGLKTRFSKHIQPAELKKLYNYMISKKKSVLIKSISHAKKMGKDTRDYLLQRGIHSLISVPLTLKSETLGLLLLGKEKCKKPLDYNKLSLAEALGSAASVAIQNARAYRSSIEMSDFLEKKIIEKTSQIEQIQKRQRIRLEHRKDIVFRVNRRNRFVFVNKAMEKLTGYSREAFYRGEVLADEIVAKKDLPLVREAFMKVLNGELALVRDLEYRQLAMGEEDRIISLTIYPERDATHRIIGIEGVGRDITQEKRLAEELKKTRELALLGEFSADIAHQIRNPLSNILMGKKRLERALKLDILAQKTEKESYKDTVVFGSDRENLAAIFGDLSEGISNLNQIVTELLQYTKTMKLTRSFQRIEIILGEIPKMFEDVIRKDGIRVVEEFDPELPPLQVDALLMGQVFQNVIHNALAAMPDGGRLLLRTGFCYERPGYAFISISDSGVGIKPSEVENVFRPFYSTKGSGAGLGLSLAHRIVGAHRGIMMVCHNPSPNLAHRISPENDSNRHHQAKGTTIHILLPLDGTPDGKTAKPVRGD
ncbi:MAG: GAF domain-containing protein [Deltaproteobacteria bacterium]|nr:GAF domain-containing protein [Deltaproteobacteria bacterium]